MCCLLNIEIERTLRKSANIHLPLVERLHRRLSELDDGPATEDLQPHSDKLINKEQSAVSDRLNRPEEAYHPARNAASMWTYDEIVSVMEMSPIFHEQMKKYNQDPASAKKYYQQYQARMDGYKRVQSKEDANSTPHKHAITLIAQQITGE